MSGYRDDSPHGGLIPTHELQRRNAEVAYEEKITRLRAENERLKTSGIAEVAAHNPSVVDYMRHWEGRTQKAEAENERLRAALWDIHAVCNAWPYMVRSKKVKTIARAALEEKK